MFPYLFTLKFVCLHLVHRVLIGCDFVTSCSISLLVKTKVALHLIRIM